jgi:hypothetical protein
MTTDVSIEQLQLRVAELDSEIESAEANLKDMKSERTKIKGRIFQIINSKNISPAHNSSPVKNIQDRKNSF